MLELLGANIATLLVAALVAGVLALIIFKLAREKKRGAASGGSACSGCPYAGSCCACHKKPDRDR